MKKRHCKSVFAPRAIALAVAGCFSAGLSLANPVGPAVVAGSAAFATQGNVLTVTNSAGAVINWQGFSIGANETTRFIQPSAASSVLNRVVTADPSLLLGTLQSNGRVFLINPAGILVGAGAVVDTAGFVASTLNLSNADFAAGKLNFAATPGAGSVSNYGTITTPSGGAVYLVGTQVENHGIINAPNGEILLAAGQTVQLVDTATPGVRVEITADKAQALNLGQLLAESGRIGVVGAAVRNSGRISASSVTQEGGRIFLKATQDVSIADGGSVEATGIKGGQADILGNAVVLAGQARVDVSGVEGGGTIRVGGDTQGRNADLRNAQTTTVGSDVVLNADALTQGNGGKVVVWSDQATRMNGSISARGGSASGNGGFVETSGKTLDFSGARVDASARRGEAGSWLLDPDSLTIDSGGAGTLGAALDTGTSGTNVHLYNNTSAYGAVTGDGQGSIAVNSPVSWSKASELWLDAATSISLNAAISNSNAAGRLRLNAGSGGINQSYGSTTISVPNLLLDSVGAVNLQGLSVDMLAARVTGGGAWLSNAKDIRIGSYTPSDGNAAINGVSVFGSLSLDNGASRLTIDSPIASTSSVWLTAGRLTNNSTVTSASGTLNVFADKAELNAPVGATYSLDAGSSGAVNIAPRTSSQTIELGGSSRNASATVLSLTQADLQRVRTSALRIGNYSGYPSPVDIAVVGDLDLTTGGLTHELGLYSAYCGYPGGTVTVNGVVSVPDYFRAVSGTFTNNGVVRSPASSGVGISINADKINLNAPTGASYGLDAGTSGTVSLSSYSSGAAIEIGGSGKNTGAGVLSLTQAELQRIRADALRIGDSYYGSGAGTLTVVGDLDLTTGGLSSSLSLNPWYSGYAIGTIIVNGLVSVPKNFYAGAATFTNNGVIRSASAYGNGIAISADKINLNAPVGSSYSIDAGAYGSVSLTPNTGASAIELGGSSKNAGAGVLSLTQSELQRVRANGLSISNYHYDTSGGNITVVGDLDLTTGGLVGSFPNNSLSVGMRLATGIMGSITVNGLVSVPRFFSASTGTFTNNSVIRTLGGGGTSSDYRYLSINADKINLNAPAGGAPYSLDAGTGGSVYISPYGYTSSQTIELGGEVKNGTGGILSLTLPEILRIHGDYLSIANNFTVSSSTYGGNIRILSDLDLTSGSLGYGLRLNAGPLGTLSIDAGVTRVAAPGELSLSAGTFTNAAADLKALGSGSESPSISIAADTVSLGTGVIQTGTGGSVDVLPLTAGRNIQVGGAYVTNALSLTEADLQKLAANNTYVSVGSAYTTGTLLQGSALDLTGTQASVALVSGGNFNVAYPITTPNAILLGARNGAISQSSSAKITAPYLVALATTGIALDNTVNQVKNVTMQTTSGSVAFRNQSYDDAAKLFVLPVSTLCSNYDVDCNTYTDTFTGTVLKSLSIGKAGFPVSSFTAGIKTGSGNIALSNQGSIALAAPVVTNTTATDGVISMEATGTGATISGTGTFADVVAYRLNATADGGIGSAATPLWSQVSYLAADGGSGNLHEVNSGALTTLGIRAAGAISVTAKSPLTVASPGVTSTGNGAVTLVAGATGSGATGDTLTINAPVTTSGTITLLAGNSITGTNVPSGSNVVATSGQNLPTLSQCLISGGLSGCSSVLTTSEASSVTTTVQTTQT